MSSDPIVLLVEDEVLIRMLVADDLRDQGYHVLEASNGCEALIVLEAATRIDLVLSDIMMPGSVDGIALARHVKKTYPFMPLILVSAALTEEAQAIADCAFRKPFLHSALYAMVRQLTEIECNRRTATGNA